MEIGQTMIKLNATLSRANPWMLTMSGSLTSLFLPMDLFARRNKCCDRLHCVAGRNNFIALV